MRHRREDFLAGASERRSSLAGDLWGFLKTTKKWWLTPIVVAILALGLLVILGGTGAAPFIYTLF
jgi:hypothetical protein